MGGLQWIIASALIKLVEKLRTNLIQDSCRVHFGLEGVISLSRELHLPHHGAVSLLDLRRRHRVCPVDVVDASQRRQCRVCFKQREDGPDLIENLVDSKVPHARNVVDNSRIPFAMVVANAADRATAWERN